MSARDITTIEEGIRASDDQFIKGSIEEGTTFCTSAKVVLLTQKVPLYILAQLLGSILASGTLYLLFDVHKEAFFGTVPAGSNVQSLVLEFITSFLLMFVISGVATDNRSIGELAGIAIGMTILIDVLVAG
ncbi:hypothetical protein RD792_011394 [Penstemon davidsonii]|uniref:Uncharacterized protein n=1 Tax=Penstemon davidsonii TaxID=160366 RepID=A0ABR0D4H1_9LAMI|nr:hypothetical protein RD792_011394 [Penstemon davidsonii]